MTASSPVSPRRRRSVFKQLLLTMSVMAAMILVVVGTFLFFFYGSQVGPPVMKIIQAHVELLARDMGDPPDPARAAALARAGGFEVRFESPTLQWTTSDRVPAEVRAREEPRPHKGLLLGSWRRFFFVPGPRGGTFIFLWNFGWAGGIHNELFISVLLLIVLFVVVAHFSIRHHLWPIKGLRRAVDRVGAGDFGVEVPVRGNDELASLAEAFNVMTRRLGEMVKSRDQLLTDVSHELRSPLTRMKLALEFMPAGEKRDRLEADLAEMGTMITELLEIERLKNGHGGLRLEPGDLAALLRESAREFSDRRPGLRLHAPGVQIRVPMDAERMRIVLKNVLENALKYSPPDGSPVDVAVEETDDSVIIRVRDEGPGIPEAEIPRVFDPFYRVDPSRSKSTGGYGLGLAMCRRIMDAHGGGIEIRNNPGRGVTVILTLPKTAPAEPVRR